MPKNDFIVVVLAAGKGTRLKSDRAKVLHRAGGRTLVEHVVRAAQAVRPRAVLCVVGHQADAVREIVEPLGAECVLQHPQNGTGHALLVCRTRIGRRARTVLVVPGDAPLICTETLDALMRTHFAGQAAATLLSAELANPTGYGRVVRKSNGSVAAIVEEKAASDEQRAIREINSSIYAFELEKLWPALREVRPENVHREIYLTDTIAILNARGERVLVQLATDAQEVLGCNTRAELAAVDAAFRARKRAALMDAGVSFLLPETVIVDPEVSVGADALIEPNVQLLGATRIGRGCIIRTGSVLRDARLGDHVEVRAHSVVTASRLGSGVFVGPFAHIRDGADLRPGARVGNFVEVKKSVLAEGVKSMHLTYIGDARVGRGTNVGAGTITCNYDGVRKNPTFIGENVFVGSNTALVAPVRVGSRAYIAAGSTITENVPADSLGIGRARQETKKGWVAERRAAERKAARRAPRARRKSKPGRKTQSRRAERRRRRR
jgi:bifunctional UDP-N-acetylglucosamine pyrophosphorylase/glucosamine-1-phosphate N-acetyltransferase